MITIETVCPFCGHHNTIAVYADDYERWQAGGLVQDCFPYLSADDREMLLSGICPKCWGSMFSDEDDEGEDA